MEETNENVVNEVKQTEVSSETTAQKQNNSDNKLIIKIIVGVLIFLTVIGVAVFIFFYSFTNKIVDESKDSINSIANLGQNIVDEALNESNMDKLKENISSVITNNSVSNGKVAITADKFTETLELKGFEVVDSTSAFNTQYDPDVKKGCLARTTDYKIEFYELNNEADALYMYNGNKTKFESQKGGTSSYSTISLDNYNVCSLTTNGKYRYICRVNNTFMYVDVPQEYMNDVKTIMNELGY